MMRNIILSVAAITCFSAILFQIQLVKCDTDFSFLNETNSTQLNEFLDQLEIKSGLGREKYTISVTCDGQTLNCSINANGTAVWDARTTLYDSFLLQSVSEGNEKQTLDGCITNSTLVEFQDCMLTVRTMMLEKLNSDFDKNLISIIENNSCELFDDNCV